MKIGLIDVDSHNFPNLCLMKLSAYHKAKGHTVEWWNAKGRYDLVYKSRVFTDTYSKDTITVTNAEQVIFGGTGYDTKNRLPPEVEHSYPDYSIYPQFFGIAYGFLSRGCPRNCGFCIVSGKEGRKSVKVADLSEFWKWQPEIKIMDANLLACPDHENLIEQLIRSRAWVDFSQGLDIRLVNRDNVSLLNRVRIKAVHFAWDNPDEDLTGYFQRFLDLTAIKSSRQRRVYVLTNYGSTHEQDLYRVNTLQNSVLEVMNIEQGIKSPRQGNAENDPRRGDCGKPYDGRNNEYQRKTAGGKLFSPRSGSSRKDNPTYQHRG